MATLQSTLRKLDRERQRVSRTVPSPERVRATAAAIRRSWTPSQRRRRAELARYLLFERLLAGMLDASDAGRAGSRPTPKSPSARF